MYLSPTTSCKLTIGDRSLYKICHQNTSQKYRRICEILKIMLWFLKCPILRRQMNRYTLLEFFETIRFWLFEFCLFRAFLFSILKFFSKFSENFRKIFSELSFRKTKFCCADPFSLKSYSYSIICVNWSHCSFFLYRGVEIRLRNIFFIQVQDDLRVFNRVGYFEIIEIPS